jgi:predicted  nucleic acid-binding Zn-ribbon protein
MKKIVLMLIVLFTVNVMAQTDSTYLKKYKKEFDVLLKDAQTLQTQIDNANKAIEAMKGKLELLNNYIKEEETKLKPIKKEEKK